MMEQIVVDASVILAVVSGEATRPVLIQKTQGKMLFAPSSLPFEIGNALSAMMRRARINQADALALYSAYQQIAVTLEEVDISAALVIAARQNIYAYDAYMIACAEKLSCPLLTLDSQLARVASLEGITVVNLEN